MELRSKCIAYIFVSSISLGLVYAQKETSPLLDTLVPHIKQDNFELKSAGQNYTLFMVLPDGSTRSETVELRKPNTPEEELFVTGEVRVFHPEGTSKVTYEAGLNGYRVKYKYETLGILTHRISAVALKSGAG